jgi:hypothetical protein
MYRSSLFDNPIAIFLLLVIVGICNIILPVHFISIFLAGVVFIAMIRAIEKVYPYTILFLLLGFIIIELSHGLKIFSLGLLALFIYLFISPRIKSSFSSETFYFTSVILLFYFGMGVLFYFGGGIDSKLITILLMNFVFDLFIVSILV